MKINYITFLILILLSACSPSQKKAELVKVTSLLDSLKTVYAPDERVALWDINIEVNSNTISVSGELDNKEAVSKIEKVVGEEYPDVVLKLKLLPENSNNQIVNALVNNSVINLRSNPRHSAEIATQVLLGTPVKILKKEGGWYLIKVPNRYIAWVDAPALVRKNKDELAEYKHSEKIIYNKQYGFSYSEPNDNSQIVTDLVIGSVLPVLKSSGNFYQVKYPDNRIAWVKKDEVINANDLFSKQIDEKELIESAMKFVGIPYLWGGTSSKAIDCSGLTSTIYYMNGTLLQRDASQQVKYGEIITTTYDWKDLLPGDLLFFRRGDSKTVPEIITHVAMYIGDSEFIHASGRVKINSMDSTHKNFIPSYVKRFVKATRVQGEVGSEGIEQISENNFYNEIINNSK